MGFRFDLLTPQHPLLRPVEFMLTAVAFSLIALFSGPYEYSDEESSSASEYRPSPSLVQLFIALFNRAFKQSPNGYSDAESSSSASEYRPSPSLIQLPVHFVVGLIKEQLPVTEYSSCIEKEGSLLCCVCLGVVDAGEEVRELWNCSHVFHRECLDCWIDRGRITCPLCRAQLSPDQSNGKDKRDGGNPWRRERMIYLFGEDFVF